MRQALTLRARDSASPPPASTAPVPSRFVPALQPRQQAPSLQKQLTADLELALQRHRDRASDLQSVDKWREVAEEGEDECYADHADDSSDESVFQTVLGDPIRVDKHALFVVVFRTKVPEKEVKNPVALAEAIFPLMTDEETEEFRGHRVVTNSQYQNFVRNKFLQICYECGFRTEAFKSVDEDEIFLKINLDRCGEVIKQLAAKFDYGMPLRSTTYGQWTVFGERATVPKDDHGRPVVAHQAYDPSLADIYEPFREIDALRIVMHRLSELVKGLEMEKQGVVVSRFPAAKHRVMMHLLENLAWYKNVFKLPREADADLLREYFGEQVAFFFLWFGFYIRALLVLASVTLVYCLRYTSLFDVTSELIDCLRLSFLLVLTVWTQGFIVFHRRAALRAQQRWGMSQHDVSGAIALESHDPFLDRTWRLWRRKKFIGITLITFISVFIVLVIFADHVTKSAGLEAYHTWAVVILIKAGSLSWGWIAGRLVNLQNHRTRSSYEDGLGQLLCTVKIFCAFFPFLYEAFIVRFTNVVCARTLFEAAQKIYCMNDVCTWPVGIKEYGDGGWLTEPSSSWEAGGYQNSTVFGVAESVVESSVGMCVSGCPPSDCWLSSSKTSWHCNSRCWDHLKYNLQTVFVFHFLTTVGFLVIPRLLASMAWHYELHLAKQRKSGREYTFLQWQAKHHLWASYTYASWGGSHTEDFLDLAISFALLTCFGTLFPPLALFALVCHLIEYRLLAYRMVMVTSRPVPYGAEGIGHWESVFVSISYLAVVINVGLVVFFVEPFRSWGAIDKFGVVILGEHALLLLKVLVSLATGGRPEDVKTIDVYNKRFLVWLKSHTIVDVSKRDLVEHRGVGLEVGARDHDTDDSSDCSDGDAGCIGRLITG